MLTSGIPKTVLGMRWLAGGLVLGLALFPAGSASAATFTAGCSGATGDPDSLVSAIDQANASLGPDTVELGAGCLYLLTDVNNNWYGPNGLPAISSNVTIEGNGATIARASSAPKFRLFFVGADPTSPGTDDYVSPGPGVLTLRDVTLTGGLAKGGDSNAGGGGAGMGGAIFSQGTVTIDRSTLTQNTARGGSAVNALVGRSGGGIGTDSPGDHVGGGFGPGTFGGASGGAGVSGSAGGGAGFRTSEPGNPGSASGPGAGGGPLTGLGGFGSIQGGDGSGGGGGNVGGGGGGVGGGGGCGDGLAGGAFGEGGNGSAGGCDLDSGAGGGGGFGAGGSAGDKGSSGSPAGHGGTGGFGGGGGAGTGGFGGFGGGNGDATKGGGGAGMGGAVFNMQGTLTILDSTLTANAAFAGADAVSVHATGLGGAVFNLNGSLTTTGATFAGNAADAGTSIYNLVYDGATARTAQATLRDTIVARGAGSADLVSNKPETVTGANDLGSASAAVGEFDIVQTMAAQANGTIAGSPLTADPLLGPLQDNGGPTATMAPAPSSPAIDAGSSSGLGVDQRGDPRPVDFPTPPDAIGGDGADIGAVEVQSACIGQSDPSQTCHTLTVVLAGGGAGAVTGAGISCPGRCSDNYPAGTTVTLTATAAAGSTFAGWSGGCTGTGACVLAMSTDRAVTATFTQTPGLIATPLAISALHQSASVWRESSRAALVTHKHKPPVGTVFSFELNEQATVTLTFTQPNAGRRVRGKCVAPNRNNHRRQPCTVIAGRLKRSAHPGANHVRFQGRLSPTDTLKPGRYTLTIVAISATGQRSNTMSLSFRIVT